MTSYRFHVGDFDCLMFKDGGGSRPVTSPEIQAILRQYGADPNTIELSISPLLIRTADQSVLVDSGNGGERGNLPAYLAEEGVGVDQVDTVVITHGHGDHVGGLVNADGGFVYPNATYVVWQTEWDYWTAADRFAEDDSSPAKAAFAALSARPDLIRLIGGADAEIMPGMCALPAPGHTPGQIAVELSSRGEKLLHIADAAHHWYQVSDPTYGHPADYDPAQAIETRRRLFERAAQDHSLLSAYHFPFPGIGHVVERDGSLSWQQIMS